LFPSLDNIVNIPLCLSAWCMPTQRKNEVKEVEFESLT